MISWIVGIIFGLLILAAALYTIKQGKKGGCPGCSCDCKGSRDQCHK